MIFSCCSLGGKRFVPFDGLDMVGAGSCGLSLNITVVGIFGTTIMVVGIFSTIAVLFQVVLIIRNIFGCPLLLSEIFYRYKKHKLYIRLGLLHLL